MIVEALVASSSSCWYVEDKAARPAGSVGMGAPERQPELQHVDYRVPALADRHFVGSVKFG